MAWTKKINIGNHHFILTSLDFTAGVMVEPEEEVIWDEDFLDDLSVAFSILPYYQLLGKIECWKQYWNEGMTSRQFVDRVEVIDAVTALKTQKWFDVPQWVYQFETDVRTNKEPEPRPVWERPTDKPGYIYLVKHSSGIYKIGRTENLKTRMRGLETSNPAGSIELIASFKTETARAKEADMHTIFAEKRDHGEWFNLDAKDVEQFKEIANGNPTR